MALYISRQLKILVSENAGLTDPVLSRGASEDRIRAETDFAEAAGGPLVISAPQTDLEIPFPPGLTTGRMFYIESDQDLAIKFDGIGNTGYQLKVPTTSLKAKWYMDLEYTSVHITLGGTTDANVFYYIVGA
jgi:hypothetical protein